MNGITYKGCNSYLTFGAVVTKRDIGIPAKNEITDKVAYSNVIYRFTDLYGEQTYTERTLSYQFSIVSTSNKQLKRDLDRFISWIYSPGRDALIDSSVEGYYFRAECISPPVVEEHGIYALISVTFTADPYKYPTSPAVPYTGKFPDINGDGIVNSTDAADILSAVAGIGSGSDSGLTPEQEALADTDGDGVISSVDATNVLAFTAAAGSGAYTNDSAGWTRFMNDQMAKAEGVI